MHNFLNIIYRNGIKPTINKPKIITRKTETDIDHIFTESFVDTSFKTNKPIENTNKPMENILGKFLVFYGKHFPKKSIKLKAKDLGNPWITSAT